MGANESAMIQVNFNRSTEFYFPGEHVSGEILFQNKHDRLKLVEIFIEIVGELAYTTAESRSSTDSNGNSTTEYYTDYHHIPFFTNHLPLARPDSLQEKIILNRGTYTWPFDVSLPENLPPSSSPNVGAYPHIKYYAQIVLNRPRFKVNVTRTYPLMIYLRMNHFRMDDVQNALSFDKQNRKQLRLHGYLRHSQIVPGQSLSVQINVHNPERTEIKRIDAAFIQHRKTALNHNDEVIFSINLPGLNEFNELYFQRDFGLPVPSINLTPTHTFSTLHSDHSYNFNVDYELLLRVKTHGIFTNFEVSIPVVVGTEAILGGHQQNNGFDETDLPPSYETVTKTMQAS
ncbi:unnamed protein product [Rotaria socialis]|uniref:Arrestin C-terminal-like domain-containing protein n=1 Tax=Rotaria socialis TaxID=392032 RepID=A0A817M6P1_9BILA|nr:unnamed protein product [Rotaria socialis]CAF3364348.1 unnamed protein product [Rotaria socialis]CAF4152635.1 unnamed protein product [Rotaria socialis]CAF4390778.1 unnamed protein product [Rotaria socialis]